MLYKITPVPKPRQTRSDKWKTRDCVMRYRAFKDEIRAKGLRIDGDTVDVVFGIPMPKSWSKKKRALLCGLPHSSVPDLDNLIKSLLDATNTDDKRIWKITACKYWGETGFIMLKDSDKNAP